MQYDLESEKRNKLCGLLKVTRDKLFVPWERIRNDIKLMALTHAAVPAELRTRKRVMACRPHKTLRLEITQSRSCSYILGSRVGNS